MFAKKTLLLFAAGAVIASTATFGAIVGDIKAFAFKTEKSGAAADAPLKCRFVTFGTKHERLVGDFLKNLQLFPAR